jgi:hypothetical protein
MTCSPKGLIGKRSVTPEEMAQLVMRWEQIGSGRGPNGRHEIKNLIAFWRWFAKSLIEANPATDDTLDRTRAAKAVLAKLEVIEYSLAESERNANLYLAIVYHCMLFASYVHQLTIIDNETPIVAWQESIKGARRGGEGRSKKLRKRNREVAQEFLNRLGGRMSKTALMVDIGAARGLERRASVNAVKSGLEDLNRD